MKRLLYKFFLKVYPSFIVEVQQIIASRLIEMIEDRAHELCKLKDKESHKATVLLIEERVDEDWEIKKRLEYLAARTCDFKWYYPDIRITMKQKSEKNSINIQSMNNVTCKNGDIKQES